MISDSAGLKRTSKFLRQAADKYAQLRDKANEGSARSDLAASLGKLGRLDEARQEIQKAIECKAQFGHATEPWTTWAVLAAIETNSGEPAAAAAARQKATECYLAYRRDGGENHTGPGRLVFDMTQKFRVGGPAAAASFLQELAGAPNLSACLRPFIQALQAIVAGSRDHTLADSPDLDHTMAAEILFLIERLKKPRY